MKVGVYYTNLEEGVVFESLNCLGGHVADGATAEVSLDAGVLVFDPIGYPEINQFQSTTDTYEVLRLQVVVNYVMTVDDLEVMKLYNLTDYYKTFSML